MKQLDSGDISVSIKGKEELGYMPQDIALNTEFTIMEVFVFYGGLYKMDQEEVYTRVDELIDFLELPASNRTVGTCSGGQQRRISMAVSLLHNPELLILDEPTVGVDPVLCNKIWVAFVDMVKVSKKTIIITTHYIEEAKNSNSIGLMRGGVLLAEESPDALLRRFDCPSLEDVFLQLSQKQQKVPNQTNEAAYPPRNPNKIPLASKEFLSKQRLYAQLLKNFIWTLKNIPVTLFVVCLPALQFFILGEMAAHGATNGATLAVVSDEPSCSLRFDAGNTCGNLKYFSCLYLDTFRNDYKIEHFTREYDAIEKVKRGRAIAVLYFPANYSIYMLERLIRQGGATKKAIDDSVVSVWVDMSEYPKWIQLYRDLWKNLIKYIQDVCDHCGFNRKVADIPLNIETGLHEGNPKFAVTASFIPTFFCIISFYTTSMFTSSAIIMERSSGSYDRSQSTGLTLVEIMLAHVVIQIGVMTAQNILSFLVLYGIYDYPYFGSLFNAFMIINIVELFGMCYGFFLATIIEKEAHNSYAGIGTVLTLFMIGGTIWPLEGIHWSLVPMTKIVPVVPAGRGYYNVMLRGRSIGGDGVLWGYFVSFLGSALFVCLTGFAVRFKLAH